MSGRQTAQSRMAHHSSGSRRGEKENGHLAREKGRKEKEEEEERKKRRRRAYEKNKKSLEKNKNRSSEK